MKSLNEISVQYIKGVGPARKKMFERLGVETCEDLLYFFPRRYEDRREIIPIAKTEIGQWQTVTGKVAQASARRSWYGRKHVLEVLIDDGSGRLFCVWFNQPYMEHYFRADAHIVCYGKIDRYKDRLQMVSPEYEIIDSDDQENLNLHRIVPVYPLTRGMSQRYLRKTVKQCFDTYKKLLRDELPVPVRNKYRLYNIKRSINFIHFPEAFKDQEEALKRISFEEFFFFQISVILRRLSITHKPGISHKIPDTTVLQFTDSFPFKLTSAQKKAIRDIRQDMEKSTPMLRLLQGDVGSGKTLVAVFGCVASFVNGYQSAFMAPTEILARQHYGNITEMMQNGNLPKMKTVLLTSGLSKKEKEKCCEEIKEGNVDLVVGTHALINEEVIFKKLSFVVVDEQHKFGVRQRALLSEKGTNPDILIMTATPIPRTLCITLYGDLDVSVLDERPPGRGEVKTRLFREDQSEEVYDMVKAMVKEGRQAYFVYPLVEESEKLDLKAAEKMYRHFQKDVFKGLRLGLVHGRMKKAETEEVMAEYKNHQIDILVATTVVEVGVDVPNASVMVIEHAERFGLSQLHQLRGRIGRGEEDGLCLLIAEPVTEDSMKRLEAVCSTHDGFKIAQYDLEIRGPGHYFGRHQHGLSELKVANPATQMDILEIARKEALALTQEDPYLEKPSNRRIKNIIRQRYPTYLTMVKAG